MKTRPTVLESVGAIAIVILLVLAIASWLLYALQVWCTKGSLKFDVERLNELEIADGVGAGFRTIQAIRRGHPFSEFWWDPGIQGSHPIGWIECFVHQMHHMLSAIAGETPVAPLAATFEDGYRTAEICDAMLRSWRSGRREPVTYRTLDQDG